MTSRATSFATYQDMVAYIKCRNNGGSETGCYSRGDSGIGAWGDVTAQIHTPMVALPVSEMVKKWGTSKAARGKKVRVTLPQVGNGRTFAAEVRDKGPAGVIDLNPASLILAGLPEDQELQTTAEWSWV